MLLDIQLKFSWSQFCTFSFFPSLFRYFCLFDQLCILFSSHFLQRKPSPMSRCFLPLPLPPCLLSPHIYVGGKMSCWLGCWWGRWDFRGFLFKVLILRFRRIVLLLHEELDCATLVYSVVVLKSADCFCPQSSICLH